ncbi:MAG: hypothetical protein QOE61_3505 [Micromonosporaceae bacterium]|jgi:DUF4097 and DUF4098 domain-containing protein YvlB|nr:hypothetical protein [Micromonosporaceae bacterium]
MSLQTHVASQEFPCPQPITTSIRVGGGSISVTVEDRPFAAVTVDPYDASDASRQAADQTEITFNGDRLRIEVPRTAAGRIFRRDGKVRVDVRIPLDSRFQAQVGSADIRTEGRLAEAIVQTGSGDTYVAQTTGLFRAETGSGDVRADEVGELRVNTASGDVSATLVAGEASVRTASGDVEIADAKGAVRTNTASGDVQIRAARGNQVIIHTASGDAEVGVPAGTSVWLDLNTASGSTNSDLTMTGVPEQGAQLNIQVRTASGDITLRRVGQPPTDGR